MKKISTWVYYEALCGSRFICIKAQTSTIDMRSILFIFFSCVKGNSIEAASCMIKKATNVLIIQVNLMECNLYGRISFVVLYRPLIKNKKK